MFIDKEERIELNIFYSYAHEDEVFCKELIKHLSILERQGRIINWHDRMITAGSDWSQSIDEAINRADVILLLISPDFLASDYCYDVEMKRALERHELREVRVIPIILRPCAWTDVPDSLARLHALPANASPISTWPNRDQAFVSIVDGLRRVIEQIRPTPLKKTERQNRSRLLEGMQEIWIEGVLKQSLHQAALITLNLQDQPDALANPWHLEVQETNFPSRPLPRGISLLQIYDKAKGELLILGEPGAGKTTLLLDLARTLLERAEKDRQACIPVIFSLSSWAVKRLSLADWLVEELNNKYNIPSDTDISRVWVDKGRIIPFLDGLDEVAEDARLSCIEAINTYKDISPVVVSCRSQDYFSLPRPRFLALQKAITIQPLTVSQIDHYLQSAGGQLEGLRQALQQDSELRELAQSPLMLSVLTLTYYDDSTAFFPTQGTPKDKQRQIFAAYVECTLERRRNETRYSRAQTLHWLTFLAQQLKQHSQTDLYLERMQPDWLHKQDLYRVLVRVSIGFASVLLSGLLCLLLAILFLGITKQFNIQWQTFWEVLWPFIAVMLFVGLLRRIGNEIRPAEVITWSWKSMWRGLVNNGVLINGLPAGILIGYLVYWLTTRANSVVDGVWVIGLFAGLISGLVGKTIKVVLDDQSGKQIRSMPRPKMHHGRRKRAAVGCVGGGIACLLTALIFGLIIVLSGAWSGGYALLLFGVLLFGLICAVIDGFTFALFYRVETEKTLVQLVAWLWTNTWKRLVQTETLIDGLLIGLLVGLLVWLFRGKPDSIFIEIDSGFCAALFAIFVFELINDVIGGLSSDLLTEKMLTRPNQGIRNSVRNSISIGFGSGAIIGLLTSLIAWLFLGSHFPAANALPARILFTLLASLFVGFTIGLPTGLANGGIAFFQHFVLRRFLSRNNFAPWDYVHFLDYATERILLQKVGGGYRFIHPLLLDYFASL